MDWTWVVGVVLCCVSFAIDFIFSERPTRHSPMLKCMKRIFYMSTDDHLSFPRNPGEAIQCVMVLALSLSSPEGHHSEAINHSPSACTHCAPALRTGHWPPLAGHWPPLASTLLTPTYTHQHTHNLKSSRHPIHHFSVRFPQFILSFHYTISRSSIP